MALRMVVEGCEGVVVVTEVEVTVAVVVVVIVGVAIVGVETLEVVAEDAKEEGLLPPVSALVFVFKCHQRVLFLCLHFILFLLFLPLKSDLLTQPPTRRTL